MQEIKGTDGPDKVVVKSGDRYRGEGGDDHITLVGWAVGEGGPGNDTLVADPGSRHGDATVWFWSSTSPIFVDLAAGYALDGLGGRDTLINIHNVHGFRRDGDKGFGSNLDDQFYLGPWKGQKGLVQIDGRGGKDRVTVGLHQDDKLNDVVIKASADGRVVRVQLNKDQELVMELRNIETLQLGQNRSNGQWFAADYRVIDLIDLGQAGPEILLRGAKGLQTGAVGKALTISFSFLTKAPPTGTEGGMGFEPFSAALQQTTRTILSTLQLQTGITFREVAGDAGTIRFGINQQADTRGYSFLPDQHRNDEKAGDVWLDVETSALMQPGQEGYYVLLHELAHALGLQHPLRENNTSGQTVLLDSFATFAHTLMLDISAAANPQKAWPTWYGQFDLQALRHLYGSKAFATGDNLYKIVDGASSASVVVLDDGGTDLLDISDSKVSGHVDMRPGKFSSVGMSDDGIAHFANLSMATNTWIENLVATPFDDFILGNDVNNTITSMGGNDIIWGHGGRDTVVLPGNSAEWNVSRTADGLIWNAAAKNGETGSVELHSVERLHFADTGLALDLHAQSTPARVAKVLSVVFGPAAVHNVPVVGIGLYFMEQLNFSYEQFMKLAIDFRLGDQSNNPSSVVNLLFGNLIGQTPTAAQAQPWVKMLVSGETSVAGLGVMVAETGLNQNNVDLVGLANNGLAFGL